MRVLYVCTANICRSPSAAAVLSDAGLAGVEVLSAGTAAGTGDPGCERAPKLRGRADEHRSQPVDAQLVSWADLVLTAAREHQSAVIALVPASRERAFTIVQVGRLAQWMLDADIVDAAGHRALDGDAWVQGLPDGDPRRFVAPLPGAPEQRAGWLVAELDAARGMAPAPAPEEPARSRWRRRPVEEPQHPDDIPDPHVLGAQWHDPVAEQIANATAPLVELMRRVGF